MQLSLQLEDHNHLDRGLQYNMQLASANMKVAKLFWSVYPHMDLISMTNFLRKLTFADLELLDLLHKCRA